MSLVFIFGLLLIGYGIVWEFLDTRICRDQSCGECWYCQERDNEL